MNGIELSKKFYNELVSKMIDVDFPEFKNRIAVGIAGKGSECFGFDDEISRDHDFEAGVSLWLTEKDDAEFGFKLMRGYSKLPKEFCGVKIDKQSLFGNAKFGVQTIDDFFKKTVGFEKIPTNWKEWFFVPDYAFAESVNGEVFCDELGEFSNFQNAIRNIPTDVKLKKLSAHLALTAQAGQYNFKRMISHGEFAGAQLAIAEFVNQILYVAFSLNNKFLPYYKWRFKALQNLKKLSDFSSELEFLLTTKNDVENSKRKTAIIESLCGKIVDELKSQQLTESTSDYLENHALSVAKQIKSREISSLHLMECGE